MIVNKCVRGATGPEILPNYEFWSDFPALLKVRIKEQCTLLDENFHIIEFSDLSQNGRIHGIEYSRF